MTNAEHKKSTNRLAPTELPNEAIQRVTLPLKRFLRIETAAGGVLLFFTLTALLIYNSSLDHILIEFWETPLGIHFGLLDSTRSLREWINDGLMTMFFLLVALELKRALVLGELRNPRLAVLSIMAAIGGMVVPALFYLTLQMNEPGQHGWGIVMATDTAFVLGCLALIGSRIPQSLRVFMLSLAIIDDIGAILIVAIGYGQSINWDALALAGLALIVLRGLALLGVRSIAFYFLLGAFIWSAVDASGIHPTITGVVLGLMTPTGAWVSKIRLRAILDRVASFPFSKQQDNDTLERKELQKAHAATREALSPVEQLEMMLHPWVGFVILPLFALANAGVPLSFTDLGNPVTVAIFFGFVLGKPIGVLAFSWCTIRSGLAVLPSDLNWTLLTAGALLAGIGFTMAIFIAELAFTSELIDSAKLGILLASVFSACAGVLLLAVYSAQNHPDETM